MVFGVLDSAGLWDVGLQTWAGGTRNRKTKNILEIWKIESQKMKTKILFTKFAQISDPHSKPFAFVTSVSCAPSILLLPHLSPPHPLPPSLPPLPFSLPHPPKKPRARTLLLPTPPRPPRFPCPRSTTTSPPSSPPSTLGGCASRVKSWSILL